LYGQVLRIFPAKWVIVTAIIIFEAGSLLCGVSQNIGQLIAGRTVSGAGAAGICALGLFPPFVNLPPIFSSSLDYPDSFSDHPLGGSADVVCAGWSGFRGIIDSRPLIGGAFTDHVQLFC
jgi:MFS family permease